MCLFTFIAERSNSFTKLVKNCQRAFSFWSLTIRPLQGKLQGLSYKANKNSKYSKANNILEQMLLPKGFQRSQRDSGSCSISSCTQPVSFKATQMPRGGSYSTVWTVYWIISLQGCANWRPSISLHMDQRCCVSYLGVGDEVVTPQDDRGAGLRFAMCL